MGECSDGLTQKLYSHFMDQQRAMGDRRHDGIDLSPHQRGCEKYWHGRRAPVTASCLTFMGVVSLYAQHFRLV